MQLLLWRENGRDKMSRSKETGETRWKVKQYFKQYGHRVFLIRKHHNHQHSIYCLPFDCFFCGNFALSLDLLWERQKGTEAEKGNTSQLLSGGWGATNICEWRVVGKETITHSLCWIVGTDVSGERGTESAEQTGGEKFTKTERLAVVSLLIMWSENNIVKRQKRDIPVPDERKSSMDLIVPSWTPLCVIAEMTQSREGRHFSGLLSL